MTIDIIDQKLIVVALRAAICPDVAAMRWCLMLLSDRHLAALLAEDYAALAADMG